MLIKKIKNTPPKEFVVAASGVFFSPEKKFEWTCEEKFPAAKCFVFLCSENNFRVCCVLCYHDEKKSCDNNTQRQRVNKLKKVESYYVNIRSFLFQFSH